MNIVTLYFSGTGNSEYIAKKFAQQIHSTCISIEEDYDFLSLLQQANIICLVYPIHHSLPPIILKEFIQQFYNQFKNKKIISLCTQQCFSGDGAMSIQRYLPPCTMLATQHFNMPNNIGSLPLWSNLTRKNPDQCIPTNNHKIIQLIKNIRQNKVSLHGSSVFARLLGKTQNHFEKRAHLYRKDIRINSDCILCNQCIIQCPTKTLFNKNDTIQNTGKCTFCHRCVNICPKKAITVSVHRKANYQYDFRKHLNQYL